MRLTIGPVIGRLVVARVVPEQRRFPGRGSMALEYGSIIGLPLQQSGVGPFSVGAWSS